nr:hybrid signal transduction histidine kinase M [Tanacetum cinerariifolium]
DIFIIALDGLPDKYEHVFDIIIHREPFPDLKVVRSMLTTTEKRLKSTGQSTTLDTSSSSLMVLLANSGNNNARRSTGTLGELRSLKLGYLSIDAYFCKIESIATILASLSLPIRKDDIFIIALDGLPDKYEHVFDIIIHREPFPDLKVVRSMLTTTEKRLKST